MTPITETLRVPDPCPEERSNGKACGSRSVKRHASGHSWCATCGAKRYVVEAKSEEAKAP